MNDRSKISDQYKKKLKNLKKHNKFYFTEDKPKISDLE